MTSSFETTLFPIVQTINEYLSNYVLVILLLGVGIWYTIKTRCVQVRCFKEGWNRVFGNITLNGKKGGGGMSSFQALATAIAAQVGTGIIVGVAGAISLLTGSVTSSAASFAIAGDIVAEKKSDWRAFGSFEMMRLMSGRNPMSSMRSASSRTKHSTWSR